MKQTRILRLMLPLMAFAIFMSSCETDNWNNIRGKGPVVSENRNVPIHRDILVSIPADVFIYQSPVRDLTIEAQANVLDAIETYVNGNELKIRLEDGAGLAGHERITIYISSAMYNNIRLSGSVNLYSETPIVTDDFDITISGSGEADVEVISNTVHASISGSGKMWIEGSTAYEEITISGSGDIYSFGLQSETSDISISGSGNAEATVEDFLKAHISGSGSIYYSGYPDVDSHVSGSGNVIHVNK
ncbi:MAG: head GIN domain-containing protein [Bacteroidota bacterium]